MVSQCQFLLSELTQRSELCAFVIYYMFRPFWPPSGTVLATIRYSSGHHQVQFWPPSGTVLAIIRYSSGHHQVQFWPPSGTVLATIRYSSQQGYKNRSLHFAKNKNKMK
jgi:hypothetical protein